MELNSIVSGIVDALRANFSQIILGVTTVIAAVIASRATNGANRVKNRELDIGKASKDREVAMQEQNKAKEIELSESQLTINRQEALYDRTYKLIATLENRLEHQAREQTEERESFRQEREGLRVEIRGFRAQVVRLEKRVAQLVQAFRDATGKEPPPPHPDDKEDGHN